MYYLISLSGTHKKDTLFKLWMPKLQGHTIEKSKAGHYDYNYALKMQNGLNRMIHSEAIKHLWIRVEKDGKMVYVLPNTPATRTFMKIKANQLSAILKTT